MQLQAIGENVPRCWLGGIGIADNGFDPQKRVQLFEDIRDVKITASVRTNLLRHTVGRAPFENAFGAVLRGGCLKRIRVGVVREAIQDGEQVSSALG